MTTDFYGLAVSRTNQARIFSAGKWLRRSAMTVMAILSVLGLLSFYRTYINPPELNIEATTQRTVNEHDQIGGFASDFVELWLTSTDSTASGLAPFIDMKVAGPPPKRDVAAATEARARKAAVIYRATVGEVDSYAVTVTVMERQIPTAVPRRKFYRMPVIVWHQQPRIIGWPLPVNGPGPGVQVKLDYPSTLEQSAPLYKVLAEFTDTYLTKTTGMDRYAIPGTVSPVGGYTKGQLLSVQLSEEPPQEAAPGHTHPRPAASPGENQPAGAGPDDPSGDPGKLQRDVDDQRDRSLADAGRRCATAVRRRQQVVRTVWAGIVSEQSGWIELAGQRVRLSDVRAHPYRYGRLLADARATRSAVCLCRPARLRLVTRCGLGGRHHVACWPHEGPDHAPGCAFFHLQPDLSGRAGYTSSAIQESADGTSIRFHAALVTRSARRGADR